MQHALLSGMDSAHAAVSRSRADLIEIIGEEGATAFLRAPDPALVDIVPQEVRDAVSYGRPARAFEQGTH